MHLGFLEFHHQLSAEAHELQISDILSTFIAALCISSTVSDPLKQDSYTKYRRHLRPGKQCIWEQPLLFWYPAWHWNLPMPPKDRHWAAPSIAATRAGETPFCGVQLFSGSGPSWIIVLFACRTTNIMHYLQGKPLVRGLHLWIYTICFMIWGAHSSLPSVCSWLGCIDGCKFALGWDRHPRRGKCTLLAEPVQVMLIPMKKSWQGKWGRGGLTLQGTQGEDVQLWLPWKHSVLARAWVWAGYCTTYVQFWSVAFGAFVTRYVIGYPVALHVNNSQAHVIFPKTLPPYGLLRGQRRIRI